MKRFSLVLSVALSMLGLSGCATSSGSSQATQDASASAAVRQVEVTAGSLNVRQGPSISATAIASLSRGERVAAPEPAENGWLYIESETGTRGYVSAQYVKDIDPAPVVQQPKTAPSETKAAAEPPAKETVVAAPANHAFSKVELGMSEAQVRNILGEPTSQANYQTGKAWIPYYYGTDTSRLDYKYKGSGVIVFGRNRYSGTTRVIEVKYDPSEDGF